MKKSLLLLLVVILLSAPVPKAEAADSPDACCALLSTLHIVNGDPDGNLRLDAPVTRAEFSKIAVAASPYRNTVAQNLTTSPFSDVAYTHWAAPYIQAALSHNLVRGYLDATFQPDTGVLLEEAATVALRLLGYDESDFGDSWPYGQLGLAANLGLTDGIAKSAGDQLTRGDIVRLFEQLLYAHPKGSAAQYLSIFELECKENTILIAANAQDPGVASDSVFTSSGTYKMGALTPDDIGKRGDLFVRNDQTAVLFLPYPQTVESHSVTSVIGADLLLDNGGISGVDGQLSVYYQSKSISLSEAAQYASRGGKLDIYKNAAGVMEYAVLQNGDAVYSNLERFVVYSALGDAVVAYQNGVSQQLRIEESVTAYDGDKATTYGTLQGKLEMGDILYVKRDAAGKITSVSFEKGAMAGPVTIRTAEPDSLFDGAAKSAAILRNGQKASALQPGDIAYYCAELNTILAYDKKVTGVYENALPNKDMPNQIVLSGVTYHIESLSAFQALSSGGSLQYGDTVTLYLGRNGEIADVASPLQSSGQTVVGLLIQSERREFTNPDGEKYSAYENSIILPDGSRQSYTSDRSYSGNRNTVVSVTSSDGRAVVNRASAGSAVSGRADAKAMRIGSQKVSDSVQILDIAAADTNVDSAYTRTYMQRLDGLELRASQVLYCQTNSSGEITQLILKNVTGDAGQYGVMLKAENHVSGMYISGSYTYDIGGTVKAETTSGAALGISGRQVCQFAFQNGQLTSATPLTKLDASIRQVEETMLKTKSETYLLSPAVTVYRTRNDGTFQMIPLGELTKDDAARMQAYYDKPQASGGRIRVIVVQK